MWGAFLEKISGIFDRRFFLAYWSPALLGVSLVLLVVGMLLGFPTLFHWWAGLDGVEQSLVSIAALLGSTLVAYVLETLTSPVVRLYEGYWPEWPLFSVLQTRQQRTLNRLLRQLAQTHPEQGEPSLAQQRAFAQLYHVRYRGYPQDPALLKPTRLGNLLAAAEEYPFQLYRLDAVLWWPRLSPLLPEAFRTQVDVALTPMIALLNLSLVWTLFALGGSVSLFVGSWLWWWGTIVLISGLLLARICYLAAANQAYDYADMVRVAFDLYRHEVLKHLHLEVPDNLVAERLVWDALNRWIYYYEPPWESEHVAQAPQLAHPFFYERHDGSSSKQRQSQKRGQDAKGAEPARNEEEAKERQTRDTTGG